MAVAPRSIPDVLVGLLRLMRPGQWVKNAFVLGPLLFAAEFTNPGKVVTACLACLFFCLLSSSVYVFNDWVDRNEDRLHPAKSGRPIASGLVPGWLAFALCGALLLLAGGMALVWLNWRTLLLGAAYVVINVAYSLALKHIVLLDAFCIAAGFVIRVLAGAYAIRVAASHWVILCTLLLALFLAFSKRAGELHALGAGSASHRLVLGDYSLSLIDQLNTTVCAATIVCYALYSVAPQTIAKVHTDKLIYSVPFVTYGVMRYLYLIRMKSYGGDPSRVVAKDKSLLLCVALWSAYCLGIIYFYRGK